jgi:ACS family allantoate permease-like MFS transporter
VLGTFGRIITKSFGFNNLQALGVQVPSGFIGFVVTLSPIRRTNNYRFHSLTLFMSILVGAILFHVPTPLLSSLDLVRSPSHLKLTTDLISCFAGILALGLIQSGSNTAGHTQKSTVSAMILLGHCTRNITAPLIFVADEAPAYTGEFIGITVCVIYCMLASQVVRLILIKRNKKREALYGEPSYDEAFTDQTDHKNKNCVRWCHSRSNFRLDCPMSSLR